MNWKQSLQDYQHYLNIERGLSTNSIQNYSLDVKKLILFVEECNSKETPLNITNG